MASTVPERENEISGKDEVLTLLETWQKEILDFTSRLIATPSPTPPGDERQVAQVIVDHLRGLGLIDDLLLIGLLTYFYRKQLRQHAARETGESGRRDREEPSSQPQAPASDRRFDPYEILGIAPSASGEAIQAAYKARMNEYHPDKVAHLGEDLQKLAHRKALEIQQAYQQLRR